MGDISPFPADSFGVELFYGGAWRDITDDVDQEGAYVSHGIRSEGGSADPSGLSFRVQNPTGKYSARNPSSPLYGLIGRNTPCRARVDLGAPWIDLDGTTNARVTAPDSSAVSITGDLDVRWEGYRDDWTTNVDLISKWATTSNHRSWILRSHSDGKLIFYWSNNGTAVLSYTSTVPVPAHAGRLAVRATIDVNDGASGHRVRFYTAPSLSGTWVQLGDEGVGVGTTSIYDSTAVVTVGKNPDSSATSAVQRVYGWEIRNGIAGSVVSSVTASSLTKGVSSFSDGSRTWTLQTGATITNRHYVFTGEVSEWPITWNRKGAPSVFTDVQAAGVSRRLGQGAAALRSPIYRTTSGIGSDLVAYWPMEDSSTATLFGPAVGNSPARITGTPSVAAYTGILGSDALPTVESALITAVSPSYTSSGVAQIRWVGYMPSATPNNAIFMRVTFTGGTLGYIDLAFQTGGNVVVTGYDRDGTSVGSSTLAFGVNDQKMRFSLELSTSGSDVSRTFSVLIAGNTSGVFQTATLTGVTLGRVNTVLVNPGRAALAGMAFGHLTIEKAITSLFTVSSSVLAGHNGEQADARIARLAAENSVTISSRGVSASSELMGYQATDTLLTLLRDAESVDGGILHDDRSALGLRMRSLQSMYTQPAAVSITYTDNLVIPFTPVDDDARTRNKVTVQRSGGSEFTVEETTGPLSTQAVPNGVGIYDESVTLNLYSDDQAEQHAGWSVHLGTWDEARYPSLGVDLAHPTFLANPVLTRDILTATVGDRVTVSDPPDWLPPDSVDVIVQGVDVSVEPLNLRVTWSCIPGRPFRAAFWSDGSSRYSGTGTVTNEALDSTETGVGITNPSGVQWTVADGSYDIVIGGERMTVTGVSGTGTSQTLTVTRSVNGVVKSHLTGAAVELYEPCYYGL